MPLVLALASEVALGLRGKALGLDPFSLVCLDLIFVLVDMVTSKTVLYKLVFAYLPVLG